MNSILVPTDLSENAANAVAYALHFSKDTNVPLVFLHATRPMIDMPDVSLEFYDPIIYSDEKEQMQFVQNHLELVANQIGISLLEIDYKIKLKIGFAVDEIIAASKKKSIDLIMMGTNGATGIDKFILGSITASVIKKSSKTVFAIPNGYKYSKPSKIVFATDYEGISNKKTLNPLFEISSLFDSKILMFHAIEAKEPIAAYIEELQVWKAEKNFLHVKHTNSIANCENIAEGIIDFAAENESDIIAIIPHTYPFFKKLLHKSVSKQVAFESKIPILALH